MEEEKKIIKFDYEDQYITMKLKVEGKHSIEFLGELYKAILEAEKVFEKKGSKRGLMENE